MNHPAVAVVEPKTILCGREGMKLHRGIVSANQNILDVKLSAFRKDFAQLGEGSFDESRLGMIVAGKWMRTFDNPIDLVVDMIEEGSAVSFFQALENFSDIFCGTDMVPTPRSNPPVRRPAS